LSEAGRLREAAEEFRHSQQVDQAQPDVVERRLVGDTGCLRSDPAQWGEIFPRQAAPSAVK